jgi:vanillate O-demethylase monooxygenase subunit
VSAPAGPPSTLENVGAPSYPLNAWYAAAWDHEVARTLYPVRVADRPLVLYRRADGTPVALADRCWHRLVPLSMGSLVGDDVECGYHGIRYDGHGRATHMPAQQTINPSACVRSYPVVEAHRFVWVWPGDPARADPTLVPDLHWNDDPAWAGDGRTISARCDYRLVVDNLMDLTHEAFVHGSSLANDELNEAEIEVRHEGTSVTVTRWMLGIMPPPFWKFQLGCRFPDYTGPVDRWQIIRFTAPSTISIDVGVAKAGTGAPEGDRSQGVTNQILNTMSPQTRDTCLYFWANARSFSLGDQKLTTQLRNGVARVFLEDETMLNAQQAAIDADPDYEVYNLNIDAGGMWARRAISALIDAELALDPASSRSHTTEPAPA